MSLPGWSIWWILLTQRLSACDLEIYEYDNHEVICSQGLSECIMEDAMPFGEDINDAVDIKTLTPYVKLCCSDSVSLCTLCLVIDTKVSIDLDEDLENEGHSGYDETEYPKASVTVCYKTASVLPTCKKVEFTVSPPSFTQKEQTVSMVIIKPHGVSFSSTVTVFSSKTNTNPHPINVFAPSLKQVCRQELRERVENCHVPGLNPKINKETNNVDLKFPESNKPLPSVCVQYERNGTCQRWNRTTIPLYSVAPCMCFQIWDTDEERMRSIKCPFIKNSHLKKNIRQNVSVSVGQGQINNYRTMLLWNLSAPCRLEGEVWPCHKRNCRDMRSFRQKLANGKWRQNSKGLWEIKGAFEDIDLTPCVMVTIEGHELGPFCFSNTDRRHWSLLGVGVLLLICLIGLIFYFLHVYIKKWVWSWNHGGFVRKRSRKSHVVLLSPPDVDDHVSELVCQLGSHLCNQGFSVSVDQWSRKEQCTLGPLPWFHSQLLKPNSRVVLFLTHKALEKTEEWANQHKQVIKANVQDKSDHPIWSPYSDVFTASLCIIQAEKQLGRVQQHFLLVKTDSHSGSSRNLPKLLQGLPLFQLPSQTQALLAELTVGGTGRRSVGGRRTGWKWSISDKWKVTTTDGPHQHKESSLKYLEVEKKMEITPV